MLAAPRCASVHSIDWYPMSATGSWRLTPSLIKPLLVSLTRPNSCFHVRLSIDSTAPSPPERPMLTAGALPSSPVAIDSSMLATVW